MSDIPIELETDAPSDLAPDEVRIEGCLHKLNGWEAGQMAQQMGRELRERLRPGWRVKRTVLRLSVYVEREGEAMESLK